MPYAIKLLKVPVTNIEVSCDFYSRHLGFDVQFKSDEYGWAQLSAGDLSLALYKPGMGGGDGKAGGSVDFHLSLPAAEFTPLSEDLLSKGHLQEGMIHTGNDGSTFIDVIDPDGNVIKVMAQG